MSWTRHLAAARLTADLEALAAFGRDAGGAMTRLALSREDADARASVANAMRDLGLQITHDQVGNLYGRRAGTDPTAAAVLTGSHLDSVPSGGRFDGPLGVLGPLEAVRAWNAAGVTTRRPIEVVVFVGEEGSRFRAGTIGSSALAGDRPVAEILALRDDAGTSYGDALRTYGDPGVPRPCPAPRDAFAAFIELHVEQGGVLENRNLAIGSVTTICGLVQHIVTFDGEANHAGATPMALRHDALAAAAQTVVAMETAARGRKDGAVATAGRLAVEPGAFNIVPGRAVVGFDLRAPGTDGLDAMEAALADIAARAASERGVTWRSERRQRVEPGPMAEPVVAAIERAAAAANLGCLRMPSGAIHDALHVAHLTSSGMVFIPSKGGRSHCPEEDSTPEAMIRGVEVLGRALLELAS